MRNMEFNKWAEEQTAGSGDEIQDQEYSNKRRSGDAISNRLYRDRHLSWWGHLNRIEKMRPVKQVWEAKMYKRRRKRRRRKPGISYWHGAA